jgi:hypothetical protein
MSPRYGAGAAIHRELFRQKSHDPAAVRVFHHHDALEPVLVVGRERHDKLLDRRVNRPEHGDHQQPALGAVQHPPADDVGGHRPERQHHQQRGDNPE